MEKESSKKNDLIEQLISDNNNNKSQQRKSSKLKKSKRLQIEFKDKKLQEKIEKELDDLDKFPANIEESKKHEVANRVAIDDPLNNEVCICCGFQTSNSRFSYFVSLEKLSEFGIGLAQYYYFLRFTVVMSLILIIPNLLMLQQNYNGKLCKTLDPNIYSSCFWLQFSIKNQIMTEQTRIHMKYINLFSIVIIILLIIFYRFKDQLRQQTLDKNSITPSDYTVMISKIPEEYDEQMLANHIENYMSEKLDIQKIQDDDRFIAKITYAYKINKFDTINNSKKNILMLLNKQETIFTRDGTYSKGYNKEQQLINLDKVQSELDNVKSQEIKLTDTAFVTFNHEKYAQQIVEKHRSELKYQKALNRLNMLFNRPQINALQLKIRRADEPDDIIWENIGLNKDIKRKNKTNTTFYTLLVLIISFLFILFMQFFQTYVNEKRSSEMKKFGKIVYIFNWSMGAIITVVNMILFRMIDKYVKIERRKSYSNYNKSIMSKLSVSMYFNTALIYFIINNILLGYEPHQKSALIEDITYVMINNAILPPLLSLLDFNYFLKLYQQYSLSKSSVSYSTQREANLIFQGPTVDLSYKYSNLLKNIWLTATYSSVIPLSIPILFLNVFLVYFTDKYLLLFRQSRPKRFNRNLNSMVVEYLEFTPLLLAFGNLFADYITQDQNTFKITFVHYLMIILSVINIFIPMSNIVQNAFNKLKVKNDIDQNVVHYNNASLEFYTDYDRSNPVTKKQATADWIDAVQEKMDDLDFNQSIIKKVQIDFSRFNQKSSQNKINNQKSIKFNQEMKQSQKNYSLTNSQQIINNLSQTQLIQKQIYKK